MMFKYENKSTRILFIGYGLLGDFVVCFKSIEMLRNAYPNSYIYYVGNKSYAQLGLDGLRINQIVEADEDLKYYYIQSGYHSSKWDALFSNANLIINHCMDTNSIFIENLKMLGFSHLTIPLKNFELTSKTQILLQGKVIDETNCAYEQVAELLLNINITTDNWSPTLNLPEAKRKIATRIVNKLRKNDNNKIIVFHPGASSKAKCLSIFQWRQVFENVLNEGDHIIIVSGPAEEKIRHIVKEVLSEFKTKFIHNANIVFASAIIEQCDIFVGHDTGFTHIAAALKVPSVVIYGPNSSINIWCPPSPKTIGLKFSNLNEANITEISDAIYNIFSKSIL